MSTIIIKQLIIIGDGNAVGQGNTAHLTANSSEQLADAVCAFLKKPI